MKIQDIINETTSAGGIASVVAPMGVMSRRKKPKTLLASVGDNMTFRNWDLDKLQDEMVKARKQGRLAWQGMQSELNRRIESGRLGKGGAVR